MRDRVTCDHFLDALGDSELAFKIRERQPTDLDSALRMALQLEVWTKEMNRHRETTKPEKSEGRRVREINKKVDSTVDTLQKDVENMKKFVGYGHGTPRNPNAGTYASGYRPPAAARYTEPSAYNGGPAAPPQPRGQYPANYGNRAESVQPSNGTEIEMVISIELLTPILAASSVETRHTALENVRYGPTSSRRRLNLRHNPMSDR